MSLRAKLFDAGVALCAAVCRYAKRRRAWELYELAGAVQNELKRRR